MFGMSMVFNSLQINGKVTELDKATLAGTEKYTVHGSTF